MPHTHRYPCCRLQSAAASLHRRRPTTPTPECSLPAVPACCRRLQDSIRIPDSGASGVHSAPLSLAPLVSASLSEAMQGTGAAATAALMAGRCKWVLQSRAEACECGPERCAQPSPYACMSDVARPETQPRAVRSMFDSADRRWSARGGMTCPGTPQLQRHITAPATSKRLL